MSPAPVEVKATAQQGYPTVAARVAAARAYDRAHPNGASSSSSGSSSGGGRRVRTQAGSRRYGVGVGQLIPEGAKVQQRGEHGTKIAAAQEVLVKLGLLEPRHHGPERGNFGPRTEAAVRSFQRRQGLPVTGKLDAATTKRLTAAGDRRENRQIDRTANQIQAGQRAERAAASGVDKPGGTHTVKPGDTLSGIAERVLGDASRWPEIAKASGLPKNFDPHNLQPGTKLVLPPTEGIGKPPAAPKPVTGARLQRLVQQYMALTPKQREQVAKRAMQLRAKG